jgi:zinc protease
VTSSTLTKQPAKLSVTLPNGLKVIAVENPVADIVSARLFIKSGQICETDETAGLFDLLTSVLVKGTADKTALQIAEVVESIGASFGADVASDYCLLSLKTVSADFETVLSLAAEVLRSPSFPEAEIELERRLILQGLRSMKEQPFGVAYNALREALYPGHPYGIAHAQTEKQIATFGRDDLQAAYQQYFRPDNMVVTVVGRLSPNLAVKLVEQCLGDWPAPSEPLPQRPDDKISVGEVPNVTATTQSASASTEQPVAAPRIVTVQETNQAFIVLGHLACGVTGPDYAALKVLTTYLGNGLSSRLFVELREKQGLAYDVSAFYPTRLGPAPFVAYIGTAPHNLPVALAGLQYEIDRLKTTPLTAEELQVCKNKLLGQYALGKQTNGQLAQTYGWYEVLGLGMDFDEEYPRAIAAVTIADVQATAQRYLVNQTVSILGPAAAVEPLKAS